MTHPTLIDRQLCSVNGVLDNLGEELEVASPLASRLCMCFVKAQTAGAKIKP
jgi:hypothetical protein